MVYLSNIPQGTDRPSNSRSQIQENFSQLDAQFGSAGDHVQFTAASNNGKHKKSTYIATTDPTTAAAEIALFAKTVSGATELYLRQPSAGTIIQMSRGAPSASAQGYTFLPGNLLLQWGNITMGSASQSFSFPLPFTSAVYNVQATVRAVGAFYAGCRTPGLSSVTIDIQSAGVGQLVYVMAIGV